jgi:two-component system nitrogen regulation sensor histidine kinase NtrY
VAHEIKNPLAPIRAAVETLRRLRAREDPAFDAYFDEATRTVLDEVFRISRIVSEFTEFARLPAPHPEPVQVEDVVRHAAALYAAVGASITVRAEACPTIAADRDQLTQVLTNLVQNALDAARAAGRTPIVSVDVRRAGRDHVEVVVADNGLGVAPGMLPRLFEPYATDKIGGTGLGLAIVRRIVDEHGGTIAYEAGAAQDAIEGLTVVGATFRLRLPITAPFGRKPPSGPADPAAPTGIGMRTR